MTLAQRLEYDVLAILVSDPRQLLAARLKLRPSHFKRPGLAKLYGEIAHRHRQGGAAQVELSMAHLAMSP